MDIHLPTGVSPIEGDLKRVRYLNVHVAEDFNVWFLIETVAVLYSLITVQGWIRESYL